MLKTYFPGYSASPSSYWMITRHYSLIPPRIGCPVGTFRLCVIDAVLENSFLDFLLDIAFLRAITFSYFFLRYRHILIRMVSVSPLISRRRGLFAGFLRLFFTGFRRLCAVSACYLRLLRRHTLGPCKAHFY